MTESGHTEIDRLKTTLEITHSLLAAVSSTDPVKALVSRIANLCRGAAAVYNAEGDVVANTGEAPASLIWYEIAETVQPDHQFVVGRWTVRTRRVALQDGVHVIAISSRGSETIELIGDLLLDTAERLLGAVHGIQYGASQRDRRENEQLLSVLHDGLLPAREHRIWNRLGQFGFTAYAPVRVLEIAPREHEPASGVHLEQLIAQARADQVPALMMLRRPDLDTPTVASAVVPDTPAADHWMRIIAKDFLVGAAAPTTSLSAVPSCVREAETALDIARGWASASETVAPLDPVLIDQIDLSTWLLAHVSKRELQRRIERTLAPLESSQLQDTLVTYLASDQSITRTAEALFVHANTVRYRLTRIEAALGYPIASAFGLSNLILALYPALIGRYAALGHTSVGAAHTVGDVHSPHSAARN